MKGFDEFSEREGYEAGQEPEAFAAYLASLTGKPVDGIATDFSGAVHAESLPYHRSRRDGCECISSWRG